MIANCGANLPIVGALVARKRAYRVCKQTCGNYIGDFKGLNSEAVLPLRRRGSGRPRSGLERGEGFPPHH